jgi:hypothetical protein
MQSQLEPQTFQPGPLILPFQRQKKFLTIGDRKLSPPLSPFMELHRECLRCAVVEQLAWLSLELSSLVLLLLSFLG